LFVTPAARATLLAQSWPGNVAQLQAVLKAAALRSEGDAVDVAHLDPTSSPTEGTYDTLQWATWEHRLIDAALHQSGGNIAEAARLLGIGRATLYRKLEAKDSPALDDDQ
jgi:transcriptional regulator of acetoin/glycerol metabolism